MADQAIPSPSEFLAQQATPGMPSPSEYLESQPDYVPDAGARMRANALSKVPHELRGYTEEELKQPGAFINPRTGKRSTLAGDLDAAGQSQGDAPTPNGLVTGPISGIGQIVRGVERTAEPSARDKAAGVHQIISGALKTASPALPAAALTAPIPTAISLLAGTAANMGVTEGAKAVGVPDEYADVMGDAAGLMAGSKAGNALPDSVKFGGGKNLGPAESDAVNYGIDNGIRMDVGTTLGSKPIRAMQAITQNTPGGAGVAKEAIANTQSDLAAQRNAILEGVNPGRVSKETAGNAIKNQLSSLVDASRQGKSDAYSQLEDIENSSTPITVHTGVRQSQVLDPSTGKPVETPITKQILAPVDMTTAKVALAPIREALMQELPPAQQAYSKGLQAINGVLDGPDHLPASAADQTLSALKAIQRDAANPKTRFLAGKVIDQMSPAVDAAVSKLGPEAVQALSDGRKLTKAQYASQATLDSLPTEPVKLFQKLTTGDDQNINLLRDVSTKAPDAIPAMGRAYLQGLFNVVNTSPDKATGVLNRWNALGPNSKQILFGKTKQPIEDFLKAVDNNLNLSRQAAQNPNPSGTAYALTTRDTMLQLAKGAGLLFIHPAAGAKDLLGATADLIGARALAKALYNPNLAVALKKGLSIPMKNGTGALSPAAAASAQGLLKQLKAAGIQTTPVDPSQQ